MDPAVWGPHFWFVLHLVSFHYPENPNQKHKDAYKSFYYSIQGILPCQNCRRHYQNYLSHYPIEPHIDSKLDLIRWVNQIHNFVNAKLGKPVLTHEQIFDIYANLEPISPFQKVNVKAINRRKELKKNSKLYMFIIILLLILGGQVYIKNKYYYHI
tara:strand:- start:728 stop:1195 length:468 start_codon:yes stop_codon:yes gene_type:complete